MVDKNNDCLEKLCKLYEKLDDKDKEIIIRLTEGLLNSQKIMDIEKSKLTEKTENTD
jgi:hypothetical protein